MSGLGRERDARVHLDRTEVAEAQAGKRIRKREEEDREGARGVGRDRGGKEKIGGGRGRRRG